MIRILLAGLLIADIAVRILQDRKPEPQPEVDDTFLVQFKNAKNPLSVEYRWAGRSGKPLVGSIIILKDDVYRVRRLGYELYQFVDLPGQIEFNEDLTLVKSQSPTAFMPEKWFTVMPRNTRVTNMNRARMRVAE